MRREREIVRGGGCQREEEELERDGRGKGNPGQLERKGRGNSKEKGKDRERVAGVKGGVKIWGSN